MKNKYIGPSVGLVIVIVVVFGAMNLGMKLETKRLQEGKPLFSIDDQDNRVAFVHSSFRDCGQGTIIEVIRTNAVSYVRVHPATNVNNGTDWFAHMTATPTNGMRVRVVGVRGFESPVMARALEHLEHMAHDNIAIPVN